MEKDDKVIMNDKYCVDYDYLYGKNIISEPFFVIRDATGAVGNLDQEAYLKILEEAERANVKSPFHVFARLQIYQSNKVKFYQTTDTYCHYYGQLMKLEIKE